MLGKITGEVVESFLNCQFKGYLKLSSTVGNATEYDGCVARIRVENKAAAINSVLQQHTGGLILRNVHLTESVLKMGAKVILDSIFEDADFLLHFDGLVKCEGLSQLGDFHYVPMVFLDGSAITKKQKLLIELHGLLLNRLQGKAPTHGIGMLSGGCNTTKVRLAPACKAGSALLHKLKEFRDTPNPPQRFLNPHCQVCEFFQKCNTETLKIDSLDLLRGMSAREIARNNQKGIFTVTQLSYTFRVRRSRKRVKKPSQPHHFALQALAIRENKVFVHGSPTFSCNRARVYVDFEGNPDTHTYYLIGAVVVIDGVKGHHSFWANDESGQVQMVRQFLEFLDGVPDYSLIHYGSYEVSALRRLRKLVPEPYQRKVDEAIERAINIVSIVSPSIYFPTYSNSLKDLGAYVGHTWGSPSASGLLSIVWRQEWDGRRDAQLKSRLIAYNLDDCEALRKVVEFIEAITAIDEPKRTNESVVFTSTLPKNECRKHVFKQANFALDDLSYANKCAYFDYQRDCVLSRTHRGIRKASLRKRVAKPTLKLNKVEEHVAIRCPSCNTKRINTGVQKKQLIIDLKFFRSGVKRWIVQHVSWNYRCAKCGNEFVPDGFPKRSSKYGHSLVSWCIYQHVALGQNMLQVRRGVRDVFNIQFPNFTIYRFKIAVAQFYESQYTRILEDILHGPLLHIDETEVDLAGKKGYVWVITSLDSVYYFYKESRQGAFLKDLLKEFKGVLVSDFYTAYDSLPVSHQRCLIHLMRDLNEDLLKNPFNDEFKEFARRFSSLLRAIVETIDRYGLKKLNLRKHRPQVECFFKWVKTTEFTTDVCQKFSKRFEKYQDKLFTFLDFDGVPWNNNNAEHAMKVFARYRRFADGRFTDDSIHDYLVILSIYQTCEYRGVDFLKFLLAEERDRGLVFGSGKRSMVRARTEIVSSNVTEHDTAETANPQTEVHPIG